MFIQTAGPFSKRGTYRMRIVLYDGYQPLLAGPDLVVGASTNRKLAVEKEGALVRVSRGDDRGGGGGPRIRGTVEVLLGAGRGGAPLFRPWASPSTGPRCSGGGRGYVEGGEEACGGGGGRGACGPETAPPSRPLLALPRQGGARGLWI